MRVLLLVDIGCSHRVRWRALCRQSNCTRRAASLLAAAGRRSATFGPRLPDWWKRSVDNVAITRSKEPPGGATPPQGRTQRQELLRAGGATRGDVAVDVE